MNHQNSPIGGGWNLRLAALRFAIELGPAFIFFLAVQMSDIYVGTTAFLASTAVASVVSWLRERRVPVLPLAGLMLTAALGVATLVLREPEFIKIHPSIINGLSALLLIVALSRDRLLLQSIFGAGIDANRESWRTVTVALIGFLILLTVLNEFVWRGFSTATWIAFKAFALPILDAMFLVWAWRYLRQSPVPAE